MEETQNFLTGFWEKWRSFFPKKFKNYYIILRKFPIAMSVLDIASETIVNKLLQNPSDILFLYYRSGSDNPEIIAKRNAIAKNWSETLFQGYTSQNYSKFRQDLIKRALQILVDNMLKTSLTIDQINESDSLTLNNYELNQSRQFNNFIKSLLAEIPDETGNFTLKLRKHQEIAKQYMVQIPTVKRQMIVTNRSTDTNSEGRRLTSEQKFLQIEPLTPYRGVLLYHDMGTGKTLTGVHMAIGFLESYRFPLLKLTGRPAAQEQKGKVIFMFFKRLEHTWTQSIYRYLNEAYDLEKYFLELFDLDDLPPQFVNDLSEIYPDSNTDRKLKRQIITQGHFSDIRHQVIQSFMRDHIILLYANANNSLLEKIKTPLRHNLLVIDEVHNIISYIHSSIMALPGRPAGKIGHRVYQWLIDSIDTKIVGLSGTPITNYAPELLILANILRGKMNSNTLPTDSENKLPTSQTTIPDSDDWLDASENVLFPLQRELIQNLLFEQSGEMLNPLLISRRINGLISRKVRDPSSDYPVSFWADTLPWNHQPVPWKDEQKQLFQPETDSILSLSIGKIRKTNVAFSQKQFMFYNKSKDRPTSYSFEEKKGYAMAGQAFTKSLGMCTYPLDPSLLYEIRLGDDSRTPTAELEDSSQSTNVNRFIYRPDRVAEDSPKIAKILSTVLDPNNRDLHFVYSRTIIYGAFHLEGYLQANGFQQYHFKIGNETDPEIIATLTNQELRKLERRIKRGHKYYIKYTDNYQFIRNGQAVYGPNIETKELIDTINYIFNSNANRYGDLIKLLIGTEKSKEGLDLRHVRQVYIMDPWWNMVNPEQAMGRAIRYLSHYREETVQVDSSSQSGSEGENETNFAIVSSGFPDIADRYVKIDLMIGVFSNDQLNIIRAQRSNNSTSTTDELAFDKAMNKLIISQQIEKLLNQSAIDCGLYVENAPSVPQQTETSTIVPIKNCLQIFSPMDIGLAYHRNILNEPIDIEFNETREQLNTEFYQITYEGEQLYRKVNIELIPIEYQTEGGLKTENSELILYRQYSEQGFIVPAYAFVKINPNEYRQIKYPAFSITRAPTN